MFERFIGRPPHTQRGAVSSSQLRDIAAVHPQSRFTQCQCIFPVLVIRTTGCNERCGAKYQEATSFPPYRTVPYLSIVNLSRVEHFAARSKLFHRHVTNPWNSSRIGTLRRNLSLAVATPVLRLLQSNVRWVPICLTYGMSRDLNGTPSLLAFVTAL